MKEFRLVSKESDERLSLNELMVAVLTAQYVQRSQFVLERRVSKRVITRKVFSDPSTLFQYIHDLAHKLARRTLKQAVIAELS